MRRNTLWILVLVLVLAPCLCLAQGTTQAGPPTAVPVEPEELSDFLSIVLGAEGAVGVDADTPRRHTFFGGIKFGLPVAVKGKPPDDVLRLDHRHAMRQALDNVDAELLRLIFFITVSER